MNAVVSAVVVAEVVEEEVGEVAVAATTTITTTIAAATTTTTMAVEEEEATRTGVEAVAAITVATKEVTVETKVAMAVLLLHSLVPAVTLLLPLHSLRVTFLMALRYG